MKKHLIALLAMAAILSFSTNQASAAPVSLSLTMTTDSGLDLSIVSGLLGNGTASFDLTGTIDVTLDDALFVNDGDGTNDTTSINFDAGALSLSDESIAIGAFATGAFNGLGINTLSSASPIPLTQDAGGPPFTYSFDPGAGGPTMMTLDQGSVDVVVFGASIPLDFVSDPVDFDIPPNAATALLTQDVSQVGNTVTVDVIMSIPLSFASNVTIDFGGVDLELLGAFVATGSYTHIISVPEPSTLVLLGIATVGLIPLWRRMRK